VVQTKANILEKQSKTSPATMARATESNCSKKKQIVVSIFYVKFPVEWLHCALWSGLVVMVTGLLAILDRPSAKAMSVATLFCAGSVVVVHTTGSVLLHVLFTRDIWLHSSYVNHLDTLYLWLSWSRVLVAILILIFDSALCCQVRYSPPKRSHVDV